MKNLFKVFLILRMSLSGGTKLSTLGIVAVCFTSVLKSSICSGSEFEVEGLLTYMRWHPSGSPMKAELSGFSARVEDAQWNIRCIDFAAAKHEKRAPELKEFASDGKDVYELVYYSDLMIAEARRAETNSQWASALKNELARVTPGVFPKTQVGSQKVLWLAFASASYLAQQSKQTMNSMFREYGEDLDLPYVLKPTRAPPYLPESLEVVRPGYFTKRSSNRIEQVVLPAPYNTGYVGFSYTVEAFTNVAGLALPVRFDADYITVWGSRTGVVTLRERYSGQVTNVVVGKSTPNLPKPRGIAVVTDHRFPSATGLKPVVFGMVIALGHSFGAGVSAGGRWAALVVAALVRRHSSALRLSARQSPVIFLLGFFLRYRRPYQSGFQFGQTRPA